MEWQQWSRQWAKLARQEGELAAVCEGAGAVTAGREPRFRIQRKGTSVHHIRTQLAGHLNAAEALLAHGGQLPAPARERRWQQCEAGLATLQASSTQQLEELAQAEVELSEEYEAAAQHAQQLLTSSHSDSGHASSGAVAPRNNSSASALATTTPAASASAVARELSNKDSLPPEVAAHDAFLQRHGSTGGWHPDDHAEFDCILRACRGNYAHCIQLCEQELGLLHSAKSIQWHATWHKELQKLQLSKQLAVKRWRMQRQAAQAALLEQQQKQGEKPAAEAEQAARKLRAEEDEKERQRAALEEWKRGREEQRVGELRRQKAEEAERRAREAQARHQRQQENRQLIEQRRLQKEAESKDSAPSAESSSCSSKGRGTGTLDPAATQRLRERNQQLLRRRAEQVKRRGAAAAEQAAWVRALQRRALEQFCGVAERDPLRLLSATSATTMRQLAALSEERTAKDSGYIRHVPRRATPGWCGGARLQ